MGLYHLPTAKFLLVADVFLCGSLVGFLNGDLPLVLFSGISLVISWVICWWVRIRSWKGSKIPIFHDYYIL